ncbi:Sld3p LALA0_S13e03576g [Lachancea lanzarotensis]|uniref:LALA0S13e03576g1_1 n=1 Tax=Lachancea lanzarotensis TaxID=1245769 RepID=A0A0C7NGH4_9SACH|nr:uncharacterized protein LALA0_S13e03576g [Lachancea lanzarotensis]CEP64813.1 LALA0S13e03576g1_1 [Lachancea lanzarotensis]
MDFDGNSEKSFLPEDFSSKIGSNDLNGMTFVGSHLIIPESLIDYSNAPILIEESEFPSELHEALSRAPKSSKHVFRLPNRCPSQWHVLENYINQHWVLWRLRGPPASPPNEFAGFEIRKMSTTPSYISYSHWLEYKLPDFLGLWGEERHLQTKESSELMGEVRMRPRRNGKAIKYRYHKDKNSPLLDPGNYLRRKYYEALFSPRVPLAYFVKSNLVRTNLLSQGSGHKDGVSYQMHLAELALEIEEFDRRQEEGLLQVDFACGIASEVRSNSLDKLGHLITSGVSDVITDLVLIFKVREIKLQIVLLLELISLSGLDSGLDHFEQKYERRLKTRIKKLAASRIPSRRRTRKKLAMHTNTQQLDYCEKLDVFVDKLCIVEAMLLTDASIQKNSPKKSEGDALSSTRELKKNLLDPEKEDSVAGLITYVLIPYFMKKVPHAVAFISRKIKGPQFEALPKNDKSQVKSGASKFKSSEQVQVLDSSEEFSDSSVYDKEKSRQSSKLYKRVSLPRRVPLPNLRSDSQLSEILDMETGNAKKYASATRGSSDVFIHKLQKRQLPASDLVLESDLGVNRSKSDLALLDETSRLKGTSLTTTFQRTTRRKVEPRRLVPSSHKVPSVQVEATPFGKKATDPTARTSNPAIIESPLRSIATASSEIVLVSRRICPVVTPSKSVSESHLQVPSTNVKSLTRGAEDHGFSQPPVKRKVRRRLFAPD